VTISMKPWPSHTTWAHPSCWKPRMLRVRPLAHLPTWRALLNDNSLFSGPHVFFKSILRYAQSRPPLPVGAQLSDAFDAAQQQIVLGAATPVIAAPSRDM